MIPPETSWKSILEKQSAKMIRKLTSLDIHKRSLSYVVKNFINGKFVESKSASFIDVLNPATQEVVCRVPKSTPEELREAEVGAIEAFKTWRETPVQSRQRVFFQLQRLIREKTEELALSITTEQGKTLADARGDVFRGLEVVETCCNMGR